MYRVEDKYSCTLQELAMLQSRIGTVLKPDSNENDEEGYSIISVYFDDIYDTHMQDTVDGNSIRDKYRIRIYNHSFDTIKLEVKSKNYNRVNKKSALITFAQMQQLLQGNSIEHGYSFDDPATLFHIAMSQRKLVPKVIVAYERKAYIYEPGNVRITFDRNIRASNQIGLFGRQEISYDILRQENDAVLEVKYDEFMPEFISQMLETGNMRQTSYSKYRLCREIYSDGGKVNVSEGCD